MRLANIIVRGVSHLVLLLSKLMAWFLAVGGTWFICGYVVFHWNLTTPPWLVAPLFVAVAGGAQILAMAAADVFGDRARASQGAR